MGGLVTVGLTVVAGAGGVEAAGPAVVVGDATGGEDIATAGEGRGEGTVWGLFSPLSSKVIDLKIGFETSTARLLSTTESISK